MSSRSRPVLRVAVALCATLAWVPLSQAQNGPPPSLIWDEVIYGDGEDSLRWPVAVASGEEGELAVADAFHPRVVLFRRAGGGWVKDRPIPLSGTPVALVFAGTRYVLSLRNPAGLAAVERPSWSLRPLALPSGSVPGALASLPDGGVLIYDAAGHRVLTLAPSGLVTREVAVDEPAEALIGLPAGGFLAAHAARGTVVRYGPDGRHADVWPVPGAGPVPAWPAGLALPGDGNLLVLDRHGGRLVVLDLEGHLTGAGSRQGWDTGLLFFPSSVAILPDGRVAVADQGNGRVQIFHREVRGPKP